MESRVLSTRKIRKVAAVCGSDECDWAVGRCSTALAVGDVALRKEIGEVRACFKRCDGGRHH